MFDEVVAGVLVDAIAAAGGRLGTAALAVRGRRTSEDLAIAQWFDTYRLTERSPALPDLAPEATVRLADTLRAEEVQAVLHELLAARLTDAPEADVSTIREMFELTLGRADVGDIAPELFDYYDGEICTLVGQLEGAEPSLLRQIRQEALSARMIAILHAIERHTAALEDPSDPRTETDFLSRYLRHVAEQHGKLEPPDFERRRRVAMVDLYVPPHISQVIEVDTGRPEREISLWQLAKEIDRSVLLGDPGGGKTTAANALLHHHAIGDSVRVPFLITLREFAAKDPPEWSVVRYIEHRLETFYQCPAPSGLVNRLLLTGRALVIFDGLDELLDASRRADVTARVERFCAEYPLTRVLVTSRLIGYDQARLDEHQFVCYRIGGFSEIQVKDYVRKWFAQEESAEQEETGGWADAFIDESSGVSDLRTNPLMLALMCILYRGAGSLPRNRAEVYEQCANLLFRKWDARRRIHMYLRAGHLLEPALRHLAWWLFTRSQAEPAVTERELIKETTAFLYGRGFESEIDARDAATEFVSFARGRMWVFSDTGTTPSGATLYSFTHRTFLEYFAAAHLAYDSDTPERLARTLAPHVARNEWEVTGELAVQIKDYTSNGGAQRIFGVLLGDRRHRSLTARSRILRFLARCLRSVDPPPQTVRKLSREILDFLLAGDLDDQDRCLPLCWLMASCNNCRELVSNQITAQLLTKIESADPIAHLNCLRIAMSSLIGIRGAWGGDGPNLSTESPLYSFWHEWQTKNSERYAAEIIEAATHDIAMRGRALWNELITIDEALDMPGGLTALMTDMPMGIFDGWYSPYLPSKVNHLISNRNDPPGHDQQFWAKGSKDLSAVGRYLKRNPEPPWITAQTSIWDDFFDGFSLEYWPLATALNEDCYLGTAAILLMTFEPKAARDALHKQVPELGPFNGLSSYVSRRWRVSAHNDLPELPVPAVFLQTFRDWSQNKLSLIQHSSTKL